VLLIILAVGAVTAIGILVASRFRTVPESDGVERAERWVIQHAPGPLQRILRYGERQTAGGVLTAIAFVLVFGTASLLGFLLDAIDQHRWIANWDESAAEWGSANIRGTARSILVAITQLGGSVWLLIVMSVIGITAWIMHHRKGTLAYLAVVGIGIVLVNNGLKLLVGRDRPDIAQLTGHSGSSFPSGHSAAAAACWAAIMLVATRRHGHRARAAGAFVAVVIAVVVATSRVLLGVHWLTDVIAGVAVGWAWFALVTVIFGGRLLRFGRPADIAHRARV
jgi:undecaprenyl-diphosphatase